MKQTLHHGWIALVLATVVTACASRLPILEQNKAGDDELSCRQLDQALDQAIVIRAEAVEEAKLAAINEMIGASEQSAQVVLGVIAIGVPVQDGAINHHHLAWGAAEARIQKLLAYKRDRQCRFRTIGDGEITESDLLARLEQIDRGTLAGDLSLRDRAALRQEQFEYLP